MENKQHTILFVDDEKSIRDTIKIAFEDWGYNIITAEDGFEALEIAKNNSLDLIITDLRMPKMDGLELFKRISEIDNTIVVIFISAYADIKCAVQAIKLGAFDYIEKSFTMDEILDTVEKAIRRRNIICTNKNIKRLAEENSLNYGIVGNSKEMQRLFSMLDRLVDNKATVLLTGESGVGKEVFANLIHKKSIRNNNKFVVINCGAIPSNLIESELFGFEKGAFTGAIRQKIGKFEQANGGTIFLDEVGELPLDLQVKFLRVIQERQIERIGAIDSIKIDVRIIAATNKDLMEEVKAGRFREDLYYRLNVINIKIPPLRDRKEDIPLLAQSFIDQFSKEYNKNMKFIDFEALDILGQQTWNGNVRELKNIIERAVVISTVNEDTLLLKHLPFEMTGVANTSNGKSPDALSLKDIERVMIINTIKQVKGNKSKAAEILGIKRQTLYNKLKEYNI